MHQEQLEGLAAFLAVAETASFTQAAQRLSVSTSAVSQAIRTLEQRLGVALFRRTTRSVSLTEAGTAYLRRVGPALREVESASDELSQLTARPAGLLRLTMPRAASLIVMRPVMRGFLEAYPDVRVELDMTNERVDVVGLGYDAGIRFSDEVEHDMIVVPVGPRMSVEVLAAPRYLERRGIPLHPN
ncbi:MAG TPA: LysR family transcriptional regulator, partial [bacterium]